MVLKDLVNSFCYSQKNAGLKGLSLGLDRPMFWTPWHQRMSTYSQPSFSSIAFKRGGVWMCKLGVISQEQLKIEVKLLLSPNRKSYRPMLRWLAQQRMTDDLEWPWMSVSRIARYLCGIAELLVSWRGVYRYHSRSTRRLLTVSAWL